MNKTLLPPALLAIILLLPMLLLSGCLQEPFQLDGVEIRDYEGEDLSSIYDLRENSIKGTQYIDKQNYTLTVSGLVNQPQTYSYNATLSAFNHYTKVVRLFCVEGWDVNILWDGLLVSDIIQASQPQDKANTVIFTAYDGYTTSLPLEYIESNDILLAFKMNNVTLPPQRGWPFQLVAESKWGYKWIKWVTDIQITDNENYKGYWERRGYSNNADLDKGYFE